MLDLSEVCEAAGVILREGLLSGERGGLEALLTPLENDQFAVMIDSTPRGGWRNIESSMRDDLRRHRLRFRVAHELAHTFFFWRHGGRPRRHLPNSTGQERFCDAFSRALLVPPDAVARMPVNAGTIIDLQEAFDVSLEVAARSLAAVHSDALVELWFTPDDGSDQLRLQWCSDRLQSIAHSIASPSTGTMPLRDRGGVWLPKRRQLLLCRLPS